MSLPATTYPTITRASVENLALKRYVETVSHRSFQFAEPGVKSRFHRDSRMVLRILARKLVLPVGSYSIRSHMGELSEPGHITLELANGSIQIFQSGLHKGVQIKIRRFDGLGHRLLVASLTSPVAALLDVDQLVERINPILSLT